MTAGLMVESGFLSVYMQLQQRGVALQQEEPAQANLCRCEEPCARIQG